MLILVCEWFQDPSAQGCAFISGTVTSANNAETWNKARTDTPQECPAIAGPLNVMPFNLPSVCAGYLDNNADTRKIKMNPEYCQDEYFASVVSLKNRYKIHLGPLIIIKGPKWILYVL
jgi:hypothetical protein